MVLLKNVKDFLYGQRYKHRNFTKNNKQRKDKKTRILGHVIRGAKYSLQRIIMQGKIKDKRIGQRRISWLRKLRGWFNCSLTELFRSAASKLN